MGLRRSVVVLKLSECFGFHTNWDDFDDIDESAMWDMEDILIEWMELFVLKFGTPYLSGPFTADGVSWELRRACR